MLGLTRYTYVLTTVSAPWLLSHLSESPTILVSSRDETILYNLDMVGLVYCYGCRSTKSSNRVGINSVSWKLQVRATHTTAIDQGKIYIVCMAAYPSSCSLS